MRQPPLLAPREGGLSFLALVFGFLPFPVTLVFFPPLAAYGAAAVFGPLAVLLAILGLWVGRHERNAGRAMAIIGLIGGAIGFAFGVLVLAAVLMDS
jgi:hypothetical protein